MIRYRVRHSGLVFIVGPDAMFVPNDRVPGDLFDARTADRLTTRARTTEGRTLAGLAAPLGDLVGVGASAGGWLFTTDATVAPLGPSWVWCEATGLPGPDTQILHVRFDSRGRAYGDDVVAARVREGWEVQRVTAMHPAPGDERTVAVVLTRDPYRAFPKEA